VNAPTRTGSGSPSVGLAGFPALLIERGLIAASDLAVAQSRSVRERIELADAVVALGVTEGDSYAALAAAAGADVIALGDVRSSELAVRLVPERLARRHSIVPLEVDNRVLTYATCRPFNAEGESDLGFAAGRRTTLKVATRSAVAATLDVCYPVKPLEALTDRMRTENAFVATALPSTGAAASAVIEMCHQIIGRALDAGTGDVHIECGAEGPTIRYRVGATFQTMLTVPADVLHNISDRFKVMARVGTAVRNRPQNGAFQLTVKGRVADVRLSTRPTSNGEAIVMRIIDAAGAGAAGGAAVQPKRRGRLRVLVTDDEPITRMLVKVLLERDRYDVLEATNGQQAVEIAMRERPSLVLIDLNMPVMDGYEAIGSLRREFAMSALPIIVLTAEDGDSVERRVLELGADDYLIKPFEPAVLMARVNAVFRRLNLVAA
jgi:CheY-like chemotaxis protein